MGEGEGRGLRAAPMSAHEWTNLCHHADEIKMICFVFCHVQCELILFWKKMTLYTFRRIASCDRLWFVTGILSMIVEWILRGFYLSNL